MTTVVDISDAAGLTKRTFFRYFTDKREVLFNGSQRLQQIWIDGLAAAPPEAGPISAVGHQRSLMTCVTLAQPSSRFPCDQRRGHHWRSVIWKL